MKIKVRINEKDVVADGNGIALTAFLEKNGGMTINMGSCDVSPSGDLVHRIWIENHTLVIGDKLLLTLIGDNVPSSQFVTKKESAKDRLKAQRDYCAKILANDIKGAKKETKKVVKP